MDVFGAQDDTRARSRLLVAMFVASLLAMGGIVHVAVVGATVLLGGSASLAEPSVPALALIGILWTSVALGALFTWLDVRAGGAVMARRLGAVQASDRSRHPDEARLLRTVAEMSIAASVPQPETFVLRGESAVNALLLGTDGGRQALVVTGGALEALDEDELRGVVAHEIAHLRAGDATLNMRLVIALGGLSAIDGVGRTLTGRGGEATVHPGTPVGWLLRGIGTLGTLPATLLRAAVSRQRELHADAGAVQFTRDPYALASALATVRDAADPAPLHLARSGHLLHLCFTDGVRPWYRRLLSTHPALDARIDAIEPHFAARRRSRERGGRVDPATAGPSAAGSAPTPGSFGLALVEASGAARGAAPAPDGPDVNGTGLSDRILLLLPDERSCLASLFAMFAPAEPLARRDFADRIAFGFDAAFANVVIELTTLLGAELERDRLGVVEHATGRLREAVQVENRRRVLVKLERVARAAGRVDLASLATLALVRRRLDVEFPVLERLAAPDGARTLADGRASLTFERMGEQFALLLSLVVEASGAAPDVLQREYERVLSCYTREPLPRRRSDEPGTAAALEDAFQTLYVQPLPIRRAFLEHCGEICRADARVTGAETLLVALFAAALDCDRAPWGPWGRTAASA